MEKELEQMLQTVCSKGIKEASSEEIYAALLQWSKEKMNGMKHNEGDRKLYYISAEFLVGKLLSNNLINLGVFEEVREVLKKHGHDLTEIEEVELEPSLGNGGLGRLAACFLDSIATLGLNGDGVGLNYHDGLFLQKFSDNKQWEEKNPWITEKSWLTKTDVSFEVPFKDFTLKSTMYDIDVPGYQSGCNKLHLFDLDSVDESIIGNGIQFDKQEIHKNLTLFLYPDDSDEAGQLLRIYQQYFMVSNAAQLILKEAEDRGVNLYHLHEHVCIQINDTHPTMVIPELIRILTEQKGFNIDTAVDVVSKTCAYTNHTILAEALEKWPISYLEKVVPHLMPIIRELDRRVRRDFHDPRVYIIDEMDRVHMAHIDIHFGYAVNGVAALHTEILKESDYHTVEKALADFRRPMDGEFRNLLVDIIVERWIDTPKDVPFSYARSIWNRKDINREEYQALLEEIRSYPIAPINKAKISDFLWVVENDFSNAKIAETAYCEHLKNTGAFADHIMAINRILFISKKIRSKEINEEVRKNLLIKVLEEYDNSSHAKIGYLIKTAMEEKVDTGYLIPYVENILKTYDDNSCDPPLIGKFCDLLVWSVLF